MLDPVVSRPDWFYVDEESLDAIRFLPGAQIQLKGRPIIHRTHLPLLGTSEAEELRTRLTQKHDWEARNAWCAERGIKLRTTQHQAIDFILDRADALVGDEQRLGKTLSALMSHDPARGRLVVVAPLSTRAVWLGWMKRLWPDVEIGICTGRKFDPEIYTKDLVIIHYDILDKWSSTKPIGTLVFDEIHFLTNHKTKRVASAVLLRAYAEKTIGLTGTPIWNMPSDLWAVAGLISPSAWGSYYEFGNRYALPVQTGYGVKYTGSSNDAELSSRLSELMIRRRWKDCGDDLPPISRSVMVADLNQQQRRKLDILAASIESERKNTAANLASYRRQVMRFKLGVGAQKAIDILKGGRNVVVWTWHVDGAEELHQKIGPERSFVIHGNVPPAERERRIAAWKASEEPVALIANMAVAQVGLDFSKAPVAIFVEIDWTPAIIGQAEMRTYDPTRPMDVIFIVANHLVDQRIVRVLVVKLGAADSIGVGAAVEAIDALRDAVMGPVREGDLDRLLEDFLASAG